jgi:hypothetical protein
MPSATVRISLATRETLRLIATQTGESMQSTLDKAIEAYRRQQFLERANAAFAALRDDPEAWQVEQEERAVWDVTLADGLEEE